MDLAQVRADPDRRCEWCRGPIEQNARRDALTCSKACRQAKHRFKVAPANATATTPRRFAYADPPYPGLARRYYGPDAVEVNHRLLIGTLMRDYPDGWALSTSSDPGLQLVLPMCPAGVRVASWHRGERRGVSHRPRRSWEPLIVWGGRARRIEPTEACSDTLTWGGRQNSHPGALMGMKPAAFCEWMFAQLGAMRGDTLDDIFPGSGAVSRAWGLFQAAPRDGYPEGGATPRCGRDGKPLLEQDATPRGRGDASAPNDG
jgi:hypothetical protein